MSPYVRQTWVNGIGGGTPISADRLNHMEEGIEDPVSSIPDATYVRVNEGPLSLLDPRIAADNTGVVDASAKLTLAIGMLSSRGGKIYIPPGVYKWSSTVLNDSKCTIIEGAGSGLQPVTGTRISADAGVNPFHFKTGPGGNGAQSALKGLNIVGQDSVLGSNDGVLVQCHGMVLEDLIVSFFGGNGINVLSDTEASPDTQKNANNVLVSHVRCYNNKNNGLAVFGVNANIGSFIGLDLNTNGQWGLYERSHLGNDYFGMHLAGNGQGGIRLGSPGSRVHAWGVYYETENKPGLQIDLGNSGYNVITFSTCARGDGVSPIVNNSTAAANFIYLDENGPHWRRMIFSGEVIGDPAVDIDGVAGVAGMLSGAKARFTNPGNPATVLYDMYCTDDGLVVTSAQGKPVNFSGIGLKLGAALSEKRVATAAAAGPLSIPVNTGNRQHVTLNGNVTALTFTQPSDGQEVTLHLIQDGTGSRTATWATNFKWEDGSVPVLTTTPGRRDIFKFEYNSATGFWREILRKMNGEA